LGKLFIRVVGSAAILGSVVVAGVALSRTARQPGPGTADLWLIESKLSALRGTVESLMAEVRTPRVAQESSLGVRVLAPWWGRPPRQIADESGHQ
jgi:hypothetical protein